MTLSYQKWLSCVATSTILRLMQLFSKRSLGFNLGSSENAQVGKDLLSSLEQRGLHTQPEQRLLVVLDGSQALEPSVRDYFGE